MSFPPRPLRRQKARPPTPGWHLRILATASGLVLFMVLRFSVRHSAQGTRFPNFRKVRGTSRTHSKALVSVALMVIGVLGRTKRRDVKMSVFHPTGC